mmetsp:Transcript_35887/g.90055  ORF Transcript_35887/g.90055 Transcript_35887/m.90055 type:complete len:230 (-) Transcript_35887:833-1522(-)
MPLKMQKMVMRSPMRPILGGVLACFWTTRHASSRTRTAISLSRYFKCLSRSTALSNFFCARMAVRPPVPTCRAAQRTSSAPRCPSTRSPYLMTPHLLKRRRACACASTVWRSATLLLLCSRIPTTATFSSALASCATKWASSKMPFLTTKRHLKLNVRNWTNTLPSFQSSTTTLPSRMLVCRIFRSPSRTWKSRWRLTRHAAVQVTPNASRASPPWGSPACRRSDTMPL